MILTALTILSLAAPDSVWMVDRDPPYITMAWNAVEGAVGYQVYYEVLVTNGRTEEGIVELPEGATALVPWHFVDQGEGEIQSVFFGTPGTYAVAAVYFEDGEVVESEKVILHIPVFADFDGNGRVDLDDFFLLADAFGTKDARFDLDGSGLIDMDDFFLFVASFRDGAVEYYEPLPTNLMDSSFSH